MTMIKYLFAGAVFLISAMHASAEGTLLIKIHYLNDQYNVVSVKHIPQNFPTLQSFENKKDDVVFRLSDDLDTTLAQGRLQNPNVIRGVLSSGQDVDQDEDHKNQTAQEGYFMLRYPYQSGMRFLQLMKSQDEIRSRASGTPSQKIDLSTFSNEI